MGKRRRNPLPTPKPLTGVKSLANIPSLAVLYSFGIDPYHPGRLYYGAKILIWDIFPCAWSGLLMALEAKECGLQNQVP